MNKKLLWIYILSSVVYFTQGIEGLPGLSFFFYLKETLHLNASTIMYLSSVGSLAWLIKPIWGYLCDNHLTKKKWITISLLGSISISLYFGFMNWLPIYMILILSLISNWNAAIRDVAVDGIMCVEGKEVNECGKIQAIQWVSITIAGIVVGLVGGYISDHYTYKIGYLYLIPIYLIILGIISKYEVKNISKESNISIEKVHTLNLLQNIKSYKELFTDKKFLYVCLFIFLYNFNPSFGTYLMFIERDIFKWSGTYMGILGAVISLISILGAILYFKIGKKIDIKKCLTYSVFIGAFTTLCYLYFTPISAVLYGIIFSIVGMFIFLNIMSWMAKSTISGKEATSFALLCSINNLAGTASTLSGAYLFPKIGLQWLIIISAFTSFLCLPLIKKVGFDNEEKQECKENMSPPIYDV